MPSSMFYKHNVQRDIRQDNKNNLEFFKPHCVSYFGFGYDYSNPLTGKYEVLCIYYVEKISCVHCRPIFSELLSCRESYLHDDRFASGVASSQDHHHLPRLHELAHFCHKNIQIASLESIYFSAGGVNQNLRITARDFNSFPSPTSRLI